MQLSFSIELPLSPWTLVLGVSSRSASLISAALKSSANPPTLTQSLLCLAALFDIDDSMCLISLTTLLSKKASTSSGRQPSITFELAVSIIVSSDSAF